MAGVVLENLSWKKLIILGVFLLVLLITFFLVGGLVGKHYLYRSNYLVIPYIIAHDLTTLFCYRKCHY